MFRIGDRVVHKDYPKIIGRIVYWRPSLGFVLVVWDCPRPSYFGGNVRTSRHIPSALRHVHGKNRRAQAT
jgi:hypothetical protein